MLGGLSKRFPILDFLAGRVELKVTQLLSSPTLHPPDEVRGACWVVPPLAVSHITYVHVDPACEEVLQIIAEDHKAQYKSAAEKKETDEVYAIYHAEGAELLNTTLICLIVKHMVEGRPYLDIVHCPDRMPPHFSENVGPAYEFEVHAPELGLHAPEHASSEDVPSSVMDESSPVWS